MQHSETLGRNRILFVLEWCNNKFDANIKEFMPGDILTNNDRVFKTWSRKKPDLVSNFPYNNHVVNYETCCLRRLTCEMNISQ